QPVVGIDQARRRLAVERPHDDAGRVLGAAVLDVYIGIVLDADDRLLVRRAAVVLATIPDRLAAPVIGLEGVFAGAAILDVHVDRRRRAYVVVRRRRAGRLIQTLLLERPADHLAVRAAGQAFRRPIAEIGLHQRGSKMARIRWIGGWRER